MGYLYNKGLVYSQIGRFFSRHRRVLTSALFLSGIVTGFCGTVLVEPFDYTNGPLVTVSGGVWSTHSGVSGQVEVINGRVDLSAPQTEDVSAPLSGQPYPATSPVVLYAGFTVNFTSLPSPSGEYFTHFKSSGTANFRAKVFALTTGAGAGQLRIGIANSANSPSVTFPTNLDTNTDYRIYVRYGINSAVATLWIDPVSEDSPSVSATDGATAGTLTSIALRQNTGIGALKFDDLRVGTSFDDVYVTSEPVPPRITQQPANTAAVEGGSATLTVAASGTAPLSYQWKFNGDELLDGTNATLVLNNLNTSQAGPYSVVVSNVAGITNSATATLTVITPSPGGTLSLVTYNLKGNFASDWTTNAAQVQAIARELQYLNPDIITVNEIPNGLRSEMTNWMTAFFPTYQLAVSPGTDGTIRSGVISRFPMTRTQSWLLNADLKPFGYTNANPNLQTFTRDLFEAEITVPGATQPLHVFTTHLKSGSDADSQDRRAAECSAISNFFATVFIPTNGSRPYLMTGDLNEDINIPMSHNNKAIQRLTSTPTGLYLTTPLNPFSLTRFTHSIQGSLDARFDYIMPNGLLSSNIVYSEVFRTDLLPSPPPPLLSDDDITASDHLPVMMIFNYPDPPLQLTLTVTNGLVELRWPSLIGRSFSIQTTTNLESWSVTASNLVSLSSQPSWTSPIDTTAKFFRVIRQP